MKTNNWMSGERAIRKLTEWCQDRWQRKDPSYPDNDEAFFVNEPSVMPWISDMTLCFNSGVPCHECRTELRIKIPEEMLTVNAILNFHKMRKINVNEEDVNLEDDNGNSKAVKRISIIVNIVSIKWTTLFVAISVLVCIFLHKVLAIV